MNKHLVALLDRIPTWPEEAQDEAMAVLFDIEEKARILGLLSPAEQAKLEALRAQINQAVERGSSHSDKEVEASIPDELDARERARKGK